MDAAAGISPQTIEAAEHELELAQERAGVELRLIHDPASAAEASLLLDEVWNVGAAGTTVMEPSLLMALAHAQNYVGAAVDPETGELIGVTVGFFSSPPEWAMHSHIAGVRHDEVGRGTGAAMKLHQRLWCLERGITQMTWTFDPLISRNAYFNIGRLGARVVEYHEDFYGQMRDGVNEGTASDRLLVSWDLERSAGWGGVRLGEGAAESVDAAGEVAADRGAGGVGSDGRADAAGAAGGADAAGAAGGAAAVTRGRAGAGGRPRLEDAVPALSIDDSGRPLEFDVPREAELVSLAIPSDIETLRGTDPQLADAWRHALRRGITELMADGWEVADFHRSGAYLLTHP
ncbi:hypothetical protein [Brevibacterium salitolerans]|uniref:GNAT family N-acetyltransferase n=1 Tax=Brevibacterium salitolerans TaxID=1403566 RepID=A0ABN2WI97_9MICO